MRKFSDDPLSFGFVGGIEAAYRLSQHSHLILDGEHYVQQRNDIDVRHIPLLYSYSVFLLMIHTHACGDESSGLFDVLRINWND